MIPSNNPAILKDTKADFKHVLKLYEREESQVLKIAHRLKKVAMNPSNIQRTSPALALCKYTCNLLCTIVHRDLIVKFLSRRVL